jgi:Zn-dependent protease
VTTLGLLSDVGGASACARCATELPRSALACPVCQALVHASRLTELAKEAEAATAAGDALAARGRWTEALALIPQTSQQHAVISARLSALPQSARPLPSDGDSAGRAPWRRGAVGAVATLIVLALGKLKFLLLGLTKASTFLSMFGFFAVYWSIHGWPLALGLVLTIYIHEMGHVAMLRRLGIESGAPLFIPGVGALVMLKQHVTDPIVDARIGLAGPVWGLGAALCAGAVYLITKAPIWWAIAELTAFLNLFNLIPIWQLDGSRGFHALRRDERWVVVAATVLALLLTRQRILFLVGTVAVYRALQQQHGPGDRRTLFTFIALVAILSSIASAIR